MSDDFEGEFRASWSGSNSKRELPKNVPISHSTSIEQVAENTSAQFWFQLYVMRDKTFV